MATICPECDNTIVVDTEEVEVGETVQCDECGTELEVVSLEPLEMVPIEEAGYDDEDDAHGGGDEED